MDIIFYEYEKCGIEVASRSRIAVSCAITEESADCYRSSRSETVFVSVLQV